MFTKIIEKAIVNHCKDRAELNDLKGIKVLRYQFREMRPCCDGATLVIYDAVCSIKAKKYENNRVNFQVNVYDNPNGDYEKGTLGIYFNGTFYES